jgi:hypothetical protein
MTYDRQYHLSFAVTATGAGVSPEKVNPALKGFRRKLQDLVLDAPPLRARIIDLDNFLCEERFAKILARYDIVFHVVDLKEQGAIDRFNSTTDSALSALIKSVKVEMDGVKIGVLAVVRPNECKDSKLWPREKW